MTCVLCFRQSKPQKHGIRDPPLRERKSSRLEDVGMTVVARVFLHVANVSYQLRFGSKFELPEQRFYHVSDLVEAVTSRLDQSLVNAQLRIYSNNPFEGEPDYFDHDEHYRRAKGKRSMDDLTPLTPDPNLEHPYFVLITPLAPPGQAIVLTTFPVLAY